MSMPSLSPLVGIDAAEVGGQRENNLLSVGPGGADPFCSIGTVLLVLVTWQDSCSVAAGIEVMTYFIGGYLLLCAAVGGSWGWYRGTRWLRWRSPHSDRPDDVSPAEHWRQRVAVLRRQRLLTTVAYAAIGIVLGLALLVFLAHRV
jgi:hypothetical protein